MGVLTLWRHNVPWIGKTVAIYPVVPQFWPANYVLCTNDPIEVSWSPAGGDNWAWSCQWPIGVPITPPPPLRFSVWVNSVQL